MQKQSNSIIAWAETPEQALLIKAHDSGIAVSKFSKKDDAELLVFLGEWRIMIGDQRRVKGSEDHLNMIMIMNKVKELYPNITLPEIRNAADLSMIGELNISPEMFNNRSFSVLYCLGVIKAYVEYKNEKLAPVVERWHRSTPKEKPMTDQDIMQKDCEAIKELFEAEYHTWLKTNEIQDPFDQLYSYLQKNKRLKMSKEDIEKAREYGRSKVAEFLKRQDGSITEAVEKMRSQVNQGDIINITNLEKKYAKKYCVYHLFKNIVDIKEFIKTIKPGEFKKDVKK